MNTKARNGTFTVGKHTIRCLHGLHALEIDHHLHLQLTKTEFRIMCVLLERRIVDEDHIANVVFNSSGDDFWAQETLKKHMDHIRGKLKKHQINVYIHRLLEYGYALAPLYKDRENTHQQSSIMESA